MIYMNENFKTLNLLCLDKPLKSKFSSKSDVVFIRAPIVTQQLKIAIKSLRSTGCQANIVLYINTANIKEANDYIYLQEYKVELINDYDPEIDLQTLEKEYLEKHPNINRLLHVSNDVIFFQKDPFSDFRPDQFAFLVEPRSIKSVQPDYNEFQTCFGELANDVKDDYRISHTVYFGSAKQYLKILNITTESKSIYNCETNDSFKHHLNYLLWSNAFAKKNVNYTFLGCESGFLNLHWCVNNQNVDLNEKGQILTASGFVPSVIQQFNEISKLEEYLYNICKLTRPHK